MRKQYEVPETEVTRVTIEHTILSNGENLNVTTYGSRGVVGDDTDGFWE